MSATEHFRARLLSDALAEGTAVYWERRAASFEWARPRPGDFHGRATRAELSRRWRELTGIAAACRARAEVARRGEGAPEVWALLAEAEAEACGCGDAA